MSLSMSRRRFLDEDFLCAVQGCRKFVTTTKYPCWLHLSGYTAAGIVREFVIQGLSPRVLLIRGLVAILIQCVSVRAVGIRWRQHLALSYPVCDIVLSCRCPPPPPLALLLSEFDQDLQVSCLSIGALLEANIWQPLPLLVFRIWPESASFLCSWWDNSMRSEPTQDHISCCQQRPTHPRRIALAHILPCEWVFLALKCLDFVSWRTVRWWNFQVMGPILKTRGGVLAVNCFMMCLFLARLLFGTILCPFWP